MTGTDVNDPKHDSALVERAATESGVPPGLLYELLALEGTFNFSLRGSRAEFARAVNELVEKSARVESTP